MLLFAAYTTTFMPLFNSTVAPVAPRMRLLCGMARPVDINLKEKQKKFSRFLERADQRKVLRQLPDLHEEATAQNDCLQCANCCKNYSPRFKTPDVKRISKHLRLKESVFIETYLNVDGDGDFVVKSSPCPFLGTDNYCSIYDVRPSDCARFPYTDEDVLLKRPRITLKNATFCPIVYQVLDKLSASLP
jgi:Fe-S-cluster containining protein